MAPKDLPDFNVIGWGYTPLGGDHFLLAIGAPELVGPKIRPSAQDTLSPYGKILLFSLDRIQAKTQNKSNFTIYSSGHRNPQGLVNCRGEIFEVEHGPKGGDELNHIQYKSIYGWPIYSTGSPYDSEISIKPYVAASASVNQFKQPMLAFVPSIGISDITSCPKIIERRHSSLGCLLISSLRAESIYITLLNKKTSRLSLLSA